MRRLTFMISTAIAIAAATGTAASAAGATDGATPGFTASSQGDLVHDATGTRFPAAAFGFTRVSTIAFDPSGEYATVTYQRGKGSGRSFAQIALVQISDMTALEHYAAMSPVIGTYFPGLKFEAITPIANGPMALAGVEPRHAWQGRFSATLDQRPYFLSLSTLDMGAWSGRVTAAYPKADARNVQARILALVGKVRATGPGHVHGR